MLAELQKQPAPPPAIVLTAFGSVERAVEIVRELGAFWYLEKPAQARVLRTILERAVAQSKLARHSQRLERQLSARGELGGFVAQSDAMRRVFTLLEQAASTKATHSDRRRNRNGQRKLPRVRFTISASGAADRFLP